VTIAEDLDVQVEVVGFPPPPSPNLTLDYQAGLDVMRHVDAVIEELRLVPNSEQRIARLTACRDVVEASVERAGWDAR